MNVLQWVKPALSSVKQFGIKNASHILMGIGTSSSLAALISAVKVTPAAWNAKADAIIEKTAKAEGIDIYTAEFEITNGRMSQEKLTMVELFKACAKYYGVAAAFEIIALVCFWMAHGIDIRRQAIWAGIATTAQEALRDYQQKTKQLLGEKTDKEIKEALAQDKVDKNPPPADYAPSDGDIDRWWIIKGQYFRSTYVKIKDAMNRANWELLQNMYLSESELFWLLDPEKNWLKPDYDSDQKGFTVDEMLVLDIDWTETPEHQPIGVIKYRTKDGYEYPPKPLFSR